MKKIENIEKLRSCLSKPGEESLVQVLDLIHFETDVSKRNIMQEYALVQLRDWPLHQYYDCQDTGDPDSLGDVQFEQDVWDPEILISFALQENYGYLGIFQIETFEDNNGVSDSKLNSISKGAVGFRVLRTYLLVAGIIMLIVALIRLLPLFFEGGLPVTEVLKNSGTTIVSAITYLFLSWLSGRASEAFESVVSLIREMREIV